MTNDSTSPVEIDETALDTVSGGLPAVQKIRDAAARSTVAAGDVDGDGRDDIIVGTGANGHVKVFDGRSF